MVIVFPDSVTEASQRIFTEVFFIGVPDGETLKLPLKVTVPAIRAVVALLNVAEGALSTCTFTVPLAKALRVTIFSNPDILRLFV
jgi:hypothetical protein